MIELDVCNSSLYDLTVDANLLRLLRIVGSADLIQITTLAISFSVPP